MWPDNSPLTTLESTLFQCTRYTSDMAEYDYLFKLVTIGDAGVGKTSLYEGYSNDQYPPPPPIISNIGIDFGIRTITLEGKTVKLQIWDTAGQERFRTLISAYYRQASGILLVYDVTCEDSFKNVGMWLNNVKEYASDNVQVIILGNKTDLTEERKVSTERGRMMAEEHSLKFIETSAQTGENVKLAFLTLAKDIKYLKDLETEESKSIPVSVSIATNDDAPRRGRLIMCSGI